MITLTTSQKAQLKKQGLAASKNNLQANQSYQSLWAPDHTTKSPWLCQLKVGANGLAVIALTDTTDTLKVATAGGFYTLLEEHYDENKATLVTDSIIEVECCYRTPRPMPDKSDALAYATFQAGLERLVTMYKDNGQRAIDEWKLALADPKKAVNQLLGIAISEPEA